MSAGEKLEAAAIFARLDERAGDAVSDLTAAVPTGDGPRDAFCKVRPERWLEVARVLRDDPTLRFDFLQCVTGVDWPKQSIIQCVYHLYSYPHRHSFVVKADLPREKPQIASVASVWPTAEWHEREQYDLLGVDFTGHPDLRRIMLPDDWPGHPLRKDWKEPEQYRGMPTSRPSPLEMLPVFDKAPDDKKHLPIAISGAPGSEAGGKDGAR